MARSQDTTWLHLAGSDDPSVYAYDRLDQIFSSIPAPEQQHPRLVHFLGKRQKHLALKNIFPHNNFGRWRSRCSVDLRIDTPSIDTSRPLLISDSDIGLSPHNTPRYHYDSNYQKSPLRWYTKELSHADVNDTLQARVVFPFADLICIFVDDFPNLDSVAQKLLRWSLLKASSFRNEVVLPRLLLIAAQLVSRDDFAGFAVGDQAGSLHRAFSSIEVFHLGDESLSPVARYRRLRETVQAQTMEALDDRRQRHQAFSAVHLSALFTKCVEHFALTTSQPFDPTEAARSLSQPASSMTKHISTFVRAATKLWFSRTAIVDYISTAVFMDAFPPNMHRKYTHDKKPWYANIVEVFEPSSMYSHYEDQILDEIGFDLKPDISKAFIDLFQEHLNGYTSIDLRRRCFERHAKVLPSLRSNITCLYCLARCPEHVLPCQHSICDICVQRFAEGLSGAESRFLLRGCELCASNVGREVILKPATAGIRVIAIDGGGTRGAVPLESLCILQDLLGELPLRACFDLALGTSSGKSSGWTDEFKLIAVLGGLITLAMFALNWSPHRCSEAFDTLSRRIFESEQVPRSLYGSLKKYLRCWISDGVYDHTCLEKHLQSIYGHSTPLFGAPHNSISAPSTKCAVTTSTISDGTPYLVSNYNGDGTGRAPQGILTLAIF